MNKLSFVDPALSVILGGSALTGLAANYYFNRKLNSSLKKTPRVTKKHLPAIYQHAGLAPDFPTFPVPGMENAAYVPSGETTHEDLYHDIPAYASAIENDPKLKKRVTDQGAIIYDPNYMRAGIMAHEAGHARLEAGRPWYSPSRFNQRWLRPIGDVLGMLAPTGAAVAGAISKSPVIGAASGLGIGALAGLPTLINEYQASHNAHRYLNQSKHRGATVTSNKKALMNAYMTYLTGALAAPTLAGGLTGAYYASKQAAARAPWANKFLNPLKLPTQLAVGGTGIVAGGAYVGPRILGEGIDSVADKKLPVVADKLTKKMQEVGDKITKPFEQPFWESDRGRSELHQLMTTPADQMNSLPGYSDNTGWFTRDPNNPDNYLYLNRNPDTGLLSNKGSDELRRLDPGGAKYRSLKDSMDGVTGGAIIENTADKAKDVLRKNLDQLTGKLHGYAADPAVWAGALGAGALTGAAFSRANPRTGVVRRSKGLMRGIGTGLGGMLGLAAAKHFSGNLGQTALAAGGGALAGNLLGAIG